MSTCICGLNIAQAGVGRPRKYCSDACRHRAQREGLAQRSAGVRVRADGLVLCTKCLTHRPPTDFCSGARYQAGLQSWCRPCYAEYNLSRRDRNILLERRSKYGVSLEDQDAMWAAQEGRCASCQHVFNRLGEAHLDHDHVTGRVRGFLCGPCNHIVGRCGEDVDHLVAVAEYLLAQQASAKAG